MFCCEVTLIDSFRWVRTEWADSRRYQALSTSGTPPDSGRHPSKTPRECASPRCHTHRGHWALRQSFVVTTQKKLFCCVSAPNCVCACIRARLCVCECMGEHLFCQLHDRSANFSYLGRCCWKEASSVFHKWSRSFPPLILGSLAVKVIAFNHSSV